jgi:hypothetical protein
MYKKEATEYDAEYVKKCDEDLSTTLIFVGHSSSSIICSRQVSNLFS